MNMKQAIEHAAVDAVELSCASADEFAGRRDCISAVISGALAIDDQEWPADDKIDDQVWLDLKEE